VVGNGEADPRHFAWGPALSLPADLAAACRTLGWLTAGDPPRARMHARFFDERERHPGWAPQDAPACHALTLRAGVHPAGILLLAATKRPDGT